MIRTELDIPSEGPRHAISYRCCTITKAARHPPDGAVITRHSGHQGIRTIRCPILILVQTDSNEDWEEGHRAKEDYCDSRVN